MGGSRRGYSQSAGMHSLMSLTQGNSEGCALRGISRYGNHVQNSVRTQLIARRVASWKTLRLPQ
jgi:hypothetical protein